MTLREWHSGKVPSGAPMDKFIHDSVRALINGMSFDMGLVAVGYLPNGNLLFCRAVGKHDIETSTSPGVYVIGSGGALAMDHLNKRKQCGEFSLARTMLHLSEALDEATKVKDKTVGESEAFSIIFRDGTVSRIEANAPLFSDWKKAFKDRDTAPLDDSEMAYEQITALFRVYQIERSKESA